MYVFTPSCTSNQENYKLTEPILKGNSDSKQLLPLQQLKGYKIASELSSGEMRISEELLLWENVKHSSGVRVNDLTIHPERMIWVVKTKSPIYLTRYGSVTDADVTQLWDAENGEFYGYELSGKPGIDWRSPVDK
ncbi:hypothetical protein Dtox_3808 [Desulfofarcimen acetoxidans DSM 771]|uniref:Uncharacterized protein n=2 Tax=Desulfofarcimen acetoxidans TaxID=58138 RepID=C8VXB7_DESAS|nr:hypothetical protein Dtox_3808 [Desulfofarcimen acetoxidans DSM 771]